MHDRPDMGTADGDGDWIMRGGEKLGIRERRKTRECRRYGLGFSTTTITGSLTPPFQVSLAIAFGESYRGETWQAVFGSGNEDRRCEM